MYFLDLTRPLNVSMFGRTRQSGGWDHNGRAINAHILILIIGGSAVFTYSGRVFPVKGGELLWIPAGTKYKADTKDFCEYYFFHFSCEIKPGAPPLEDFPPRGQYSFTLPPSDYSCICLPEHFHLRGHYEGILNKVVKCQNYSLNLTRHSKLLLDLTLAEIFISLSALSQKASSNQNTPPLLGKAVEYIHINYTKSLSLQILSEHFKVSKSYLARLFREFLHTTVTGYIGNLRLEHGAELLKNSNMNITEIADYLGYSDCYYFSRKFKERFSVSPTNYWK